MTPNRTVAQLEAIRDLAARMAVGWAAYEATEAALAAPTMRSAGDNTRSSDVPDPVHAIAVSLEPHAETCAEIVEALGHLIAAERRVTHVRHNHSDVARHVDAAIRGARCVGYGLGRDDQGGAGEAFCTNNSVVQRGANAGLCWTCIARKRRAEKTTDEAAG